MFIHDLEFISSFNREYAKSNRPIQGGARASTRVGVSATNYAINASASAWSSGEYNRANTRLGVKLLSRNSYYYDGYIAGYGVADANAYAVNRYDAPVQDNANKLVIL